MFNGKTKTATEEEKIIDEICERQKVEKTYVLGMYDQLKKEYKDEDAPNVFLLVLTEMTIEIDEEEKQMVKDFNEITAEILALFAKIPNGCPAVLCKNCSLKYGTPLCKYLKNKTRISLHQDDQIKDGI